jgi:membrane protein required for colicin V production
MGAWNWLDWTLAGIAVISVLTALAKGFTRELISLAAVVMALTVASMGYHRTSPWFEHLARSHQVALGLGFLALFLGVLLLGALVSGLARRMVKGVGLEGLDHLLGAGFGAVRGLVIDSVVVMALVAFAIQPQAVQHSVLAPYISNGARVIAGRMPEELKSQFRDRFDKLRGSFNQNNPKRRS